MDSAGRKLLIAIPDLPDDNFFRSVVFVIEHTKEGAMGVILNRPTGVNLKDFWERLDRTVEVLQPGEIYLGGPVNGPIMALHDQTNFQDQSVMDGLYMTMSGERLNDLVATEGFNLKVFSGYSGWGPGQLDGEIAVGGWLVMPAQPEHVFAPTERLYKDVCERFGAQIILPKSNQSKLMSDPGLN
jgi:putative transcriptional regulator